MDRFLPYSTQSLDREDIENVIKVLRSDWLTQGPAIERFEHALREYCGTKFAVAFSSGTAALHAAYYAAGLTNGESIITSPNTFVATANAALYLGAYPIFADIEPDTGNISAEEIERKLTPRTRLVVPVHYAGQSADMKMIGKICKRAGVRVIEDASHALGGEYGGRKIGCCKWSDMAVFSFHPVKPITTGEGGAVLTNNRKFYESLKKFRTHGITKTGLRKKNQGSWYYEMQELGYNYRITDLQCALGSSQLQKIDTFISQRRRLVEEYRKLLEPDESFLLPAERDYGKPAWHLFPLRLVRRLVPHRKWIFEELRRRNLGVQVHYIPVYLQPYYRKLGFKKGLCPNAEEFYSAEISIPLHQKMRRGDVRRVCRALREAVESAGN